jgi:hypothetical protein
MDVHVRGGLKDVKDYPTHVYNFEGLYTIPYGCYYSRDISNLMMAGRDISVSKMAFSSVRVMGTCSVGGQAVGTAAALAIQKNCTPRELGKKHIRQLQQQLMKDDCYIPGFRNEDEADLARNAKIHATSETAGCEAVNVINGVARTVDDCSNCWESAPLDNGPQTITLQLPQDDTIHQIRLTFDTNLSGEIMPSLTTIVRERQEKGLPSVLVRDYQLRLLKEDVTVWEKTVNNNGQRLNVHEVENVDADKLEVTVVATHGCKAARIFEIRMY